MGLIRYDDAIERLGAHLMANAQIDWGGTASTDIEEWKELADMILNGVPTVDAVSVVHGEWKGYNADKEDWLRKDGTPIFLVCNKCYGTVINNGSAHWNYCPNCGARMKGADDDEN